MNDELLRALVRRSGDGILVIDGQGTVLEWNEGEEEITGILRSEAVGQPIWVVQQRLLPAESRTAELLRQGETQARDVLQEGLRLQRTIEEQIQRPDGTRRIIESALFAIPAGEQTLTCCITRDISERRRLEGELKKRQALLLETERLTHVGHWELDLRDGRIYWSDELHRILGQAPGAVAPARQAFLAQVAPPDREVLLQVEAAILRDGATRQREFRILRADGELRHLLGTVELLRDAEGAPQTLVGTVQDITERKRADEALRESEGRFRTMADSTPVLIWVGDAEGMTRFVNRAYREFTGKTMDEVEGSGWQPLLHPDDVEAYVAAFGRALREQTELHAEARLQRHDGQWRWFEAASTPRFSSSGKFRGMVGTCYDITDRKRMEEALALANRAKDEFLAMLSHELRNPLAAVRNSLYVVSRAEPGGQQARRMHGILERQVGQLTRLVDDLLDVTRISRGKTQLRCERLELGELASRSVEDHRSTFTTNGVQLELRTPSQPLWLDADPARLAQVVGNLLTNAAKFTPRGGRVDVEVERDGDQAVLRVRDTGAGISPELLGHLFEPFVQADRTRARSGDGLGLGLALVKGLTELQGGTVSVTSEGPERGATFTVRLPLAATEP